MKYVRTYILLSVIKAGIPHGSKTLERNLAYNVTLKALALYYLYVLKSFITKVLKYIALKCECVCITKCVCNHGINVKVF